MLPEHLQTQSHYSLHPMSKVGVEPTKSPGSRPGRFSICVLGRALLGGREGRREKVESGQETAAFLLLYFLLSPIYSFCGEAAVRRAGVEPAMPLGAGGLQPLRHANAQPTRWFILHLPKAGFEPADTRV